MAIYFLGVPTLSFVVCTEGDKFNSFLCQKRHNAQEKNRAGRGGEAGKYD